MSCITLKVDILAGTDIKDAAKDSIELARRIGVAIEFDFNSICLIATERDKPKDVINDFYAMRDDKR